MKYKSLIFTALASALILTGCTSNHQTAQTNSAPQTQSQHSVKPKARINQDQTVKGIDLKLSSHMNAPIPKPFPYQHGRKIFQMRPLDNIRRAQGTHIQLKENQTPTKTRSAYLTVRPSGWHNYKFTTKYQNRTRYTWLYNRGHLVGYQFCGLNNEPRNLITETTYMNQGSLHGMNAQNKKAMLYYENNLRMWMRRHPKYSLDYSVTPYYNANDLVARYVVLTYTGYKNNGKNIRINLHSNRQHVYGKTTCVLLPNTGPQAKIDYHTGFAKVYNANGSVASRGWYSKSRY